jgi:hypothetical protein
MERRIVQRGFVAGDLISGVISFIVGSLQLSGSRFAPQASGSALGLLVRGCGAGFRRPAPFRCQNPQ